MNAAELNTAMLEAKRDMDAAMTAYRDAIRDDAEATDESKREMAKAFLRGREHFHTEGYTKPTVDEIRAWVDVETAVVQKKARMSEGLKRASGMAVENARQWLSSLQSLAAAQRAEAQFATWTPSEVASVGDGE